MTTPLDDPLDEPPCREQQRPAPDNWSTHVQRSSYPAIPASAEVAQQLPNTRLALVGKLPQEPRFCPTSVLGRMLAGLGQTAVNCLQAWPIWTKLWSIGAKSGHWSNVGFGTERSCFAPGRPRLGSNRPRLVKVCRIAANMWPKTGNVGRSWSESRLPGQLSGNCGTSVFRKCWAIAALARIAGGNSGRAASNCPDTLG